MVFGLLELEIEWFKDGNFICDSYCFKFEFGENKFGFIIKDVK